MGARERLQSCLQEVWFWEEQMNRVEEKMAEALEKTGLAEFLLSVPGIGVITAAGFLGEVGDPAQYEHWRQWQKLAGLNLCEDSSGEKEGRRTIAKRGRAGLRSVLYKMSMVLVAKNAQFKALYQYFKNRPVNPLKSTQALVAIMVKLLRVLFTLVKKKTRYDAGKVLGRARLRQLGVVA
jgi:transposase